MSAEAWTCLRAVHPMTKHVRKRLGGEIPRNRKDSRVLDCTRQLHRIVDHDVERCHCVNRRVIIAPMSSPDRITVRRRERARRMLPSSDPWIPSHLLKFTHRYIRTSRRERTRRTIANILHIVPSFSNGFASALDKRRFQAFHYDVSTTMQSRPDTPSRDKGTRIPKKHTPVA